MVDRSNYANFSAIYLCSYDEKISGIISLIRGQGDAWAKEDVPYILGLAGPGIIPALQAYLDDQKLLHPYRVRAALGLVEIALAQPAARNQCLWILIGKLEPNSREAMALNTAIIYALVRLKAVEAASLIHETINAGNVFKVAGTWEAVRAKLGVAAEPDAPHRRQDVATVTVQGVTFEFAHILAGTFLMGSLPDEAGRGQLELQHQVTLSRPFQMQTTLVTQAQWQAVMGSNPSKFQGLELPVECVSWDDAQSFITRMNQMLETTVYRLPTEAEWEYTARAETTTPFWTGVNLTTDQANYHGGYPYNGNAKGQYRKSTTPVKTFPPNPSDDSRNFVVWTIGMSETRQGRDG